MNLDDSHDDYWHRIRKLALQTLSEEKSTAEAITVLIGALCSYIHHITGGNPELVDEFVDFVADKLRDPAGAIPLDGEN
jgi:hypothetical protein